ncbi:amino acid adenylation domain-containing protein, partial [Micromonospora chersina]|uniref:amino acid adenylation domain-containing protein n=1 Tax=Micromonospora chersina TaxID=47854 RepID=UPI0037187F5D
AAIWAELLDLDHVGVTDNFFDLGGHSLLATQVVSRIHAAGHEITVADLFDHPTVAALAAVIEQATTATLPPITLADRGRPLPLSFAQERLWFLAQMDPGSVEYNVPLRIPIDGPLDVPALAAALTALVERHEILRTRLIAGPDGQPVQVIDPATPITLTAVGPEAAPDEALIPFDLAAGPMLRAGLIRIADERHVLTLGMHHVVCDEWSTRTLRRELSALRDGGALAPLPIQYADFASWQRRWFTGPVREQQLDYWRRQLARPPILDLPSDRPRPPIRSGDGAMLDFAIPAQVTEAIRDLARRTGTTTFMVLLAAYAALLHRYTGQDDLLIGTPVANRNHPDTEPLIGFFVNTLALRFRLDGDPTFTDLLGQARRTALAAYAHQDLPFEQLVTELVRERDRSHTPLVQTLFTFATANEADEVVHTGEHRHDPVAVKFDLSLVLEETGAGLVGGVHYSTALFESAWADRFTGHLLTLLADLVAAPERPMSRAGLLTAAEREQLRDWNDRALRDEPFGWVTDEIGRWAAQRPDAPALHSGEGTVTYRDLDELANRLAHHLLADGAGPEAVIGVHLDRGIEQVAAMLAVWRAGCAYLPLDPKLPRERIDFMAADAGARIVIDRDWLDDPAIAARPAHVPGVRILGDQAAYLIYTSGSTGRPKAVLVTHRGLANLIAGHRDVFGIGPETVRLQFAALGFDVAVAEAAVALASGATLVIADAEERTDPERLVALIAKRGVTVATLPPTVLAALEPERLSGLATLGTGGEQLDADLAERWARRHRLINSYGPTETTVCATTATVPAAPVPTPPIGYPLVNTTIHVLDRWLRPVPVGVPGEIFIGGEGVSRGYFGRPARTAGSFVPDHLAGDGSRLYRTGDLARRLPDGQLVFLGRTDHQVKIRGHRIEPAEVQNALTTHPAVAAAVVVAHRQQLVAYLIAAGELPPADELRAHLGAVLPAHMIPAVFIGLSEFPLTVNGKVDRAALPEPDDARPELSGAYVAPSTPVTEALAAIWGELLGLDRVGTTDDFFDLGGHSLLAVRVVGRIRTAFGVDVSLATLFEHPTVSGLATVLDRGVLTTAVPITPVDRSRPLPLSFGQQRLWFLAQLEPDSVEYHVRTVIPFDEPVDADALAAALTEVVTRHEVLRTRIVSEAGGEPRQIVDPPAPVVLGSAADDRPFDLATEPPIRAALVGSDLVLTMHHIVADEWSGRILRTELLALYAGRRESLPQLPVQYADFAVWQRTWLSGQILDRQLAYWRSQLAEPPVLELPTDRVRPPVRDTAGRLVEFELPPALVAGLRRMSQKHGVTLFTTLLAAYVVFLRQHSGQDDVLVGTPVAGRQQAETEGLIGFFVNTLALRSRLDDDPAFGELLGRTKATVVEAYAHQDLPFEQLVDELVRVRDRSRTPLVQTVFNYTTVRDATPPTEIVAKFDIRLIVSETAGDGLLGAFEYSTALFDAATVQAWAQHLLVLLEAVVADPDR